VNLLDMVIMGILALAGISGWRTGLVPGVVLLIGIVVGSLLGGRYGYPLGHLAMPTSEYAPLVGFILVFCIAVLGAWAVGRFLQGIVHTLWLGWLDRLGGTMLSVVLSMVLLAGVLVGIEAVPMSRTWAQRDIKDSKVAHLVVEGSSLILSLLPGEYWPKAAWGGHAPLERGHDRWLQPQSDPKALNQFSRFH